MIWYKAWLESRWRFLICFGLVALLVAADVYQADINMPRLGMKPDEFGRYVWKLYFTRFGLEWTLSVLILSMGGLLRERSMGTADYSLSLPVTRRMWMGVRGSMAVAQASVLAFVPVVVVPLTAQVIGRSYPFSEATKFSVLTLLTGVFILMVGMLYSSLFQGEYIGVALGVSTVFFTAVAVNPLVQRYPSLGFSNFEQYLDSSWYLTKEWPWPSVLVKLVIAAMLWELATRVVEKRDF